MNFYEENENPDLKLGKNLYDRTLENGDKWRVVIMRDSNKSYGTEWNFIEKGTNLEGYGELKNDWLINYNTGEIIELKEDSYDILSFETQLAVTEGLLFNLDASNVSEDIKTWGSNTTLYYFDENIYDSPESRDEAWNDEQRGKNVKENNIGYDRQKSEDVNQYLDTENIAFKFNGNNYIEIYSENGFDFSDGLTFEFYGNIVGHLDTTFQVENWLGLIGFWSGNFNDQCTSRFGIVDGKILYSPVTGWRGVGISPGEWSLSTSLHNQVKQIDDFINKEFYFSIVLENKQYLEEGKIKQYIFCNIDNNIQEYTGWLARDYYSAFLEKIRVLSFLEFGRCTWTKASNWGYIIGNCYNLRMYNKSLSSEEIKENCEKSKLFHNYLINTKE